MSDKTNKLGQGRPFKMAKWVEGLKVIIKESDIPYLTDSQLLFLVNETLQEKDQISKPTFERWKAGKFHEDENIGKEFFKYLEFALINQKLGLINELRNDSGANTYNTRWLLERKFSDFNLKHISENVNKNEGPAIIQISSQNDEQKALLDSIINNTEFIEVKPKQIQNNNENEDEIGF